MEISITDPLIQTQIFIIVFLITLVISAKLRHPFQLDNQLTAELKGLAMLAIIFSHIGYFLVSDHRFLYPLSVAAGVGVNLFLFLSGYGLTLSSLKNPLSIKDFYLKRLLKLFIPLWIVLTFFIGLDFFMLNKTYSLDYLIQSFLGIFLTSNPFGDIDSPLWYFTLILFFYLLFPLIFRPKRPFLSGIIILVLSFLLLRIPLPLHTDNIKLYQLHFLAFPLGVLAASMKEKIHFQLSKLTQFGLLIIFCLVFAYLAIHSGVGEGEIKEQAISIISAVLVILIFLLKNFQSRALNLVGKYSYEIYLLHWPIMYRYDIYYQNFPASLATVLYLVSFIILAIALQKIADWIFKKIQGKSKI